MSYGLYISAEGALAQNKRLETIANNLANVDNAGFKRDLAVLQARYAEETEQGLDFPGSRSINDVGGGVMVAATQTDYSQAGFKHTEIPTDMAIAGEGFFVVQKEGKNYLTRAGDFVLDANGFLKTQQGYPVLSESLQPIAIDPVAGPWKLTEDGGIQQGTTVNYLALMRTTSLADLVKTGENLFWPLSEPVKVPPESRRVLEKHLELSGVRPTTEMVDLIEASRAFEANVNLIRAQDQMFGTLIGRLLRAA
jgi:flagellar basal-body rod protein FlgF/flagellar basal-body rod protein FlgG